MWTRVVWVYEDATAATTATDLVTDMLQFSVWVASTRAPSATSARPVTTLVQMDMMQLQVDECILYVYICPKGYDAGAGI